MKTRSTAAGQQSTGDEMNPLLVILQPRDIPQFVRHMYLDMQDMKYDRLFGKYTRNNIAYHKARQVFLDHKEYTHYIYGTDDLLFSESSVDTLVEDYEKHFFGSDTTVLAADMNLDMEDQNVRGFMLSKYGLPKLGMGVSHNETESMITLDMYHFSHRDDTNLMSQKESLSKPALVKCSWSGLGLAIIPRFVIDHTTFNNDLEFVKSPIDSIYGCCIDLIFAVECAYQSFDIYTDLNVSTLHLKPSVKRNLWLAEYNKVDKKPPEWFFLKAYTDERIDVPYPGLEYFAARLPQR
jgi:hypothetical protein